MAFNDSSITFGAVGLQGENTRNPTAIAFSQAGHPVLFVTQQTGEIWRFETERQADGSDGDTLPEFVVTSSMKISDMRRQHHLLRAGGTPLNPSNDVRPGRPRQHRRPARRRPSGAVPGGDRISGDIGINAVWSNGVIRQVSTDGDPVRYHPGLWNIGGASSFVSIDKADDGVRHPPPDPGSGGASF